MNVCVVIPAAGRSERFADGDKLAQDLGGRSLLVRTAELFTKRAEVGSIIIAGPAEGFDAFKEKFGPTLSFHGAIIVPGGVADRWESVRNALQAVPDDATHVAVHDAARPGSTADMLDRVFEAARQLDAVAPGVAVAATLKRVSSQGATLAPDEDVVADLILGEAGRMDVDAREVVETLDRTNVYAMQTPQIFERALLQRAYAQDDLDGATDDAMLVERLGVTVYVVEGDVRNLKVTTRDDLDLMRAVLGVRPPADRPVHKRF